MVSTSTLIYTSNFLSSWGDRMWYFAIPLFLLDLEPESLTLTAAFGLTLATSVLIFGPLIGDWIDRRPRLYCARLSLVIQNCAVIICALILLLEGDKQSGYIVFVKVAAIVLGAIAMLASTGEAIIIQKDWIVVLAGNDQEMLADLNSTMRRIDLVTKILAPAACGQIMSLLSLSGGAIFIMCWNGVSMFVEYFLLKVVYKRTPLLSKKRSIKALTQSDVEGTDNMAQTCDVNEEIKQNNEALAFKNQENTAKQVNYGSDNLPESKSCQNRSREVEESCLDEKLNDSINFNTETKIDKAQLIKSDSLASSKSVRKLSVQAMLKQMFGFVITLKNGWKLYISQPIVLACVGFSFLYMTLLGFGYITIAYANSQCLSELTVGLLSGGAAITGIIATYMFPWMRRNWGLKKTGVISAFIQLITLIPCIVSIFLIGSPFYLLPQNQVNETSGGTLTVVTNVLDTERFTSMMATTPGLNTNESEISTTASSSSTAFIKCLDGIDPPASYLSMALLMTGIILARIGLWGFDLTITQLIQESVAETERGLFNGVQSSLNNLMDLLSYIFVLALPLPSQFGILVLISAAFVSVGYCLFFIYAGRSTRYQPTKTVSEQ